MKGKEKLLNRVKLLIKLVLLLGSASLSFMLFLVVVVLFNLPYIRRAVFGKLPFEIEKKPWSQVKTFQYMKNLWIDVFYPRVEPRGIVLFAHGGGWISGYRRQPNNLSWYRFLVSKGFIVAAIDYSRGYRAKIDQLNEELSRAIVFLDENRLKLNLGDLPISLMGLSAGGHLALLTAARMYRSVKSVVAYYAPCDLKDILESSSLFARIALITTLKRFPLRSSDVLQKYSPVNVVHKLMPPVLLVHGKKDSVVPYQSSVKMYRKLKRLGCRVVLLTHHKADHGFEFVLRDDETRRILQKTVEFLSEGGQVECIV